jgi:hypothetical protein
MTSSANSLRACRLTMTAACSSVREDLAVGVAEAAERGGYPFQAGRRLTVERLGRQF